MWRLQPKSLGNIFCQKGRYNNHQDTKIRWWWNHICFLEHCSYHGVFFHTATFFNVAGCFQFKITSAGSLDIWSQVLLGLDEFGRWFFILFNPCICFLILYTIIFLHEKTMRSWVVKVVWIYIYDILWYMFLLCVCLLYLLFITERVLCWRILHTIEQKWFVYRFILFGEWQHTAEVQSPRATKNISHTFDS